MTATTTLKPARTNMMGGWIQVVDAETGVAVLAVNFPSGKFKPEAFVSRVVRRAAKIGYEVKTIIGLEGHPVLAIG